MSFVIQERSFQFELMTVWPAFKFDDGKRFLCKPIFRNQERVLGIGCEKPGWAGLFGEHDDNLSKTELLS
jgi:hypothetical protein